MDIIVPHGGDNIYVIFVRKLIIASVIYMLKIYGSQLSKIFTLLDETFEFCKPFYNLSSGEIQYLNRSTGINTYYSLGKQRFHSNDRVLKLWLMILPTIRINKLIIRSRLPRYIRRNLVIYKYGLDKPIHIKPFKATNTVYYNFNLTGKTLVDDIMFPILKDLVNGRNLEITTPFSKVVCKRLQAEIGNYIGVQFCSKN